jgi:hypothetical protein
VAGLRGPCPFVCRRGDLGNDGVQEGGRLTQSCREHRGPVPEHHAHRRPWSI